MMLRRTFLGLAIALAVALPLRAQTDPLPSWNEGVAKTTIVAFVGRVTAQGGKDFVAPEQRIAVFDNDGTLWAEQPVYFQFAFVADRIKAMAYQHPDWKTNQPFKAILEGDMEALAATGEKGLLQLLAATHSGLNTAEFADIVEKWIATARHPRFNRPYTDMVYQPMLELLRYLRANGFKTFIVSGGGIEFMRPWTERVYGIPPEQVIGSSGKTVFRLNGDTVELEKLPEVEFVDDGPGKPVGINRFIGRQPIFAAGNSDGDLQMLQWTTLNGGPCFALIVHHTDAAREWAYDRGSHIGRLDKALDEAPKRGWLVVDMKADWKTVFPFQIPKGGSQ
jgi:phosphoglycolate phosphatase-like HAD superfamily hydrolase